eukprot:121122-Prorocentrum_minimum.AAC.4
MQLSIPVNCILYGALNTPELFRYFEYCRAPIKRTSARSAAACVAALVPRRPSARTAAAGFPARRKCSAAVSQRPPRSSSRASSSRRDTKAGSVGSSRTAPSATAIDVVVSQDPVDSSYTRYDYAGRRHAPPPPTLSARPPRSCSRSRRLARPPAPASPARGRDPLARAPPPPPPPPRRVSPPRPPRPARQQRLPLGTVAAALATGGWRAPGLLHRTLPVSCRPARCGPASHIGGRHVLAGRHETG